uniref:Uncharacterized protein n=2 Tax=Caenorhabditis japonica TaxID=281687 RepID=A0A8R1ERD3_CAEJA
MVFVTKRKRTARLSLSETRKKLKRKAENSSCEENGCFDKNEVVMDKLEVDVALDSLLMKTEASGSTERISREVSSSPVKWNDEHFGSFGTSTEELETAKTDEAMNATIDYTTEFNPPKIADKSTQADFDCENTTTEFSFFSEEMFLIKEENIRIKQEIKSLETKWKTQRIRYLEVISARNRFRRQLSAKCEKLDKVNTKLNQILAENQKLAKIHKNRHAQSDVAYSVISNTNSKKERSRWVIKFIQEVTKEDNICEFVVDFLGFLEEEEGQTCSFRLSIWQSVVLKTRASISRFQIEQIKQVFVEYMGRDVLPPVKPTCQLSNKISGIDLYQASTVDSNGMSVTIIQCSDVRKLVAWSLEELSAAGQLIFDEYTGDDVVLGIGGDSGGGTTKLCVLFGNVRQPNSTKHILTVAVYDDADTYEKIGEFLQPLIAQLNNLETISFLENGRQTTRNVVSKVVGDFKFISEMLGHKKQSCKYFCSTCFEENKRGENSIGNMDETKKSEYRTTQFYQRDAESGSFGVKMGSGPLLKNVSVKNYLPGMLHLITGVFNKYVFEPLWQHVMEIDNDTDFIIFRDMKRTVKEAEMKIEATKKNAEENEKPEEREVIEIELGMLHQQLCRLNEIVTGCEGTVWKKLEDAWESLGASRKAFFQNYTGNHVKLLLSQKGVDVTRNVLQNTRSPKIEAILESMEQLHTVMHLSRNKLLEDTEIEEFDAAITKFVSFLKCSLPSDSVTVKLHTLVFHSRDVLRDQLTLGRLSEQGIEATHALFNRLERRFVSFRCKRTRYKQVLQELLCNKPAAQSCAAADAAYWRLRRHILFFYVPLFLIHLYALCFGKISVLCGSVGSALEYKS